MNLSDPQPPASSPKPREPGPFRVGLTGGIASGKSAVAEEFARLGIPVIDADVIARELVAPGQPALTQIVEAFGPGVLDGSGGLDRQRMRERVFAQPGDRQRLEAILHPAVRSELIRRAREASGPYVVLAIPLLVENDLGRLVDRILVVDVPEALQLERLMARDQMHAEAARRILAAQASRLQRLAAADDVIANTGTLEALGRNVRELHDQYVRLASESTRPSR